MLLHSQGGISNSVGQIPITTTTTTMNGGTSQRQQIGAQSGSNNGAGNVGGQVKVIYAVPLGPNELHLECANCHTVIKTRVVSLGKNAST